MLLSLAQVRPIQDDYNGIEELTSMDLSKIEAGYMKMREIEIFHLYIDKSTRKCQFENQISLEQRLLIFIG